MFTLPNAITQHFRRQLLPRKAFKSPETVTSATITIMKAAATFRMELCRTGNTVFLLNGKDKVLSLRPEYCDPNYKEHPQVVNYRANVFNTITKQMRFVDLVPGQMLSVR